MKDVIVKNLQGDSFPKKIENILIIAERESELTERNSFLEMMRELFPGSKLDILVLEKEPSRDLRGKYTLVTFAKPHDVEGSTRKRLEEVALKINPEYTMIYEERYGTARIASRWQMIYRLYFRDEAILLFKIIVKFFIIFPAYVFYYGCKFIRRR